MTRHRSCEREGWHPLRDLIDVLEEEIDGIERELRRSAADSSLSAVVDERARDRLGARLHDRRRERRRRALPAPAKLISYTGLCPRVRQWGEVDRRGALSKHGPPYLRWALIEAAHNPIRCYPPYRELADRQRARLGKQRGGSVAVITIARRVLAPRRASGCLRRYVTSEKPPFYARSNSRDRDCLKDAGANTCAVPGVIAWPT